MLFFSLQTKSNDLKYFYKKEKLREKDMNKEDATDCANTLSGYHEFIIYGLIQNNSGDWGVRVLPPHLDLQVVWSSNDTDRLISGFERLLTN